MGAAHDLELVKAALDGDQAAWERLVDVCEAMAARFAGACGEPPGRSATPVREALEAILASLPHYRGETPLFVFAFGAMARGLAPRMPSPAARGGEPTAAARAAGG